MELHICATNLHLFQSLLLKGCHNKEVFYLLDSKRLKNSPYLFLLDNFKVIDFSEYNFFVYEQKLIFKIKKLEDKYRQVIFGYDNFKTVYLSNPIDPIATIAYNYHKKNSEIYFFDDGLFSAKLTKEYEKIISHIKIVLLHWVKNIFRYWYWYRYGYELLWSKHSHAYINNKDKKHIIMLRGYEAGRKNITYLENKISKKKIDDLRNQFTLDRNKKYYFLSFNDNPKDIYFNNNIIYVGHPKVNYSNLPVVKDLPAELIVLTQDTQVGLSSLRIIKKLGMIFYNESKK